MESSLKKLSKEIGILLKKYDYDVNYVKSQINIIIFNHKKNISRELDSLDYSIIKLLKISDKHRTLLCEILKKPRTTIYDRLKHLLDLNIISKYQKQKSGKKGRPIIFWKYNEV